jgi:hypothetical protein
LPVHGDERTPTRYALPAIWLDGALHFCAGSHEQKAKNLQANPGCVLAAGANQFRAGLDVVVEGPAVLVTDPARLQQLAALWKSKLDWDFKVTDGRVPRSGWPPGARVRHHSGEGPRVRQEPLQPDPVSLRRLIRDDAVVVAGDRG